MLPRDETHLGSKVSAVLELGTLAYCGVHGRCGFGANTADSRNPLAGGICPEDHLNAAVESLDPQINLAKERVEFGSDFALHPRQTVRKISENHWDGAPSSADRDADGDPAVQPEAAHLADERRAMVHQTGAGTMQASIPITQGGSFASSANNRSRRKRLLIIRRPLASAP